MLFPRVSMPCLIAAGLLISAASCTSSSSTETKSPPGAAGPVAAPHKPAESLPPPIRPRLSECLLTAGQHTLRPTRAIERWRPSHEIGDLTIIVEGEGVTAQDTRDGKARWTTWSPGHALRWLGADERTLYLTQIPVEKPRDAGLEPPRIQRVRLSDGSWLDPLDVPADGPARKTTEAVKALAASDTLVVLTSKVRADKERQSEAIPIGYRVTGFSRDGAKVAWSKAYPSAGNREAAGAYLLASTRPDYADDSVESLVLLGDLVLVCAGPLEDLVCFELKSGDEKWRLPRVWEYERGFIGPSVWNHTLGRYGMDSSNIDLADGKRVEGFHSVEYRALMKKRVKEARERVKRQTCAVIAGPIVVPLGERGPSRIFVVVARSEADEWPGYLSDCVIYEVSEDGRPTSTVTLPRLVNGWEFQVVDSGVVFGCSRDSILRLAASEYPLMDMLGSNDKLCRVEWYRDLKPETPKAWLASGSASTATAFATAHGFRVHGGGYILNAGDHVYRFPLVRIDLKNGVTTPLRLDVPFDGEIQRPTTNYTTNTSGGVQVSGPYVLAVTGLEARGGALRIVLGLEGHAEAVDFDLGELTRD